MVDHLSIESEFEFHKALAVLRDLVRRATRDAWQNGKAQSIPPAVLKVIVTREMRRVLREDLSIGMTIESADLVINQLLIPEVEELLKDLIERGVE